MFVELDDDDNDDDDDENDDVITTGGEGGGGKGGSIENQHSSSSNSSAESWERDVASAICDRRKKLVPFSAHTHTHTDCIIDSGHVGRGQCGGGSCKDDADGRIAGLLHAAPSTALDRG